MRQHISPVSCGHRQAKALVARGNKRSQGLNAMQMSGGGRRAPPADRVHRRAAAGRTRQRQTTSPGQAARSGPRPGNRSHPERSGQRRYRSARWPWAALSDFPLTELLRLLTAGQAWRPAPDRGLAGRDDPRRPELRPHPQPRPSQATADVRRAPQRRRDPAGLRKRLVHREEVRAEDTGRCSPSVDRRLRRGLPTSVWAASAPNGGQRQLGTNWESPALVRALCGSIPLTSAWLHVRKRGVDLVAEMWIHGWGSRGRGFKSRRPDAG